MRTPRRASVAALALVALLAGALTGTGAGAASAADPTVFTVRPSVNQVYVVDATPGAQLELLDGASAVVATGTVDSAGSLAWRELDAGAYTVRTAGDPASATPVTVADFDDAPPPQSFYDGQTLTKGFNYITTRDGTTLSANVVLPSGNGPFPTVVEYSGYDPSNPANTTFSQLYTNLGFAYVGVNIRGTGCSGGSFLNFEPIQSLDGYDAIETIAAQPWAAHHEAGMVGISYPGISQLYVARTQPPHLSAITPLSVIDDTYRGTLYPGGILNTGFAVPWAAQRQADAAPYGEGWEQPRVDKGDTVCADNQALRLQNPDPLALIRDNPFYDQRYYEPLNQSHFAPKIDVPVFLAGAWQDEQTGGHFPAILDDFSSSPHLFATMTNGSHTESLSLGVFGRYADFLDLYVGHRVPGNAKSFVAPILANALTGVNGQSLPPGPTYDGMSYEQAKKSYESAKPIRILFEEGAAQGAPSGAPLPRYEKSFSSWPIPSATPRSWFLSPHGALRSDKPAHGPGKAKPRSYRADPAALPATDYTGSSSGIWKAHPAYDWRQIPAGKGLGWVSKPLRRTVVAIGTGSVDLWVRTPARDTDLEVTLSEVRPNGTEVYVQSGWLRTSHRKLDRAASTPISPVHTDLEADAAPLPTGRFTKVRVELFPFAQAFRAGSRLRITVDAPGGARPLWAFDTIAHGERVRIAADRRHPSKLVLPLVKGVAVPKKAPACASLRSQPCRTFAG
ncbi:CocE/NonD family hydrolase [Nocardioides sp. KIGAM211]|uniref:CocE/NonD family hydrolase n=1 Tax=Nocardioides luti TaxID=2761101 RepID=A0A7X0VAI7_9ACTN|nr:CocE/NonD family hydrolase [Nocardioides luti]MBB6626173.1 CocE/NonD family hydrolase [Nocardioides luti]